MTVSHFESFSSIILYINLFKRDILNWTLEMCYLHTIIYSDYCTKLLCTKYMHTNIEIYILYSLQFQSHPHLTKIVNLFVLLVKFTLSQTWIVMGALALYKK